ncbi:MAG: TIR domain-containing protein [Lachnospiraceae bacterium]|nr:TIR domain-containing protein [Candidatus Equihabitans merdae]
MNQDYIAFISYRHNPIDKAAAVKIQQLVEHYKIPKQMRKDGKDRLGLVFRDEDELNVSSNLTDELCQALDRSQFLIVICTPQYKESKWCRQEISYFLEHHDIEHVLPILVTGTPQESFPEELFQRTMVDGKEMISEPLAANVAADNIPQIEKNIAHEYLRIIARMLDCNYNELVQRQKRYERRRRLIASSVVLAFLVAFIGMLLVKNSQVNAQYQESRQNQARNLVTLSLQQYAQGDRAAAIESALAVLPEDLSQGPVVPEQIYALSTATSAYDVSYAPVDKIVLKDGEHRIIADDVTRYYVYSLAKLQVYSLEDQSLLYTFRVKDYVAEHPDMTGIWEDSPINGVEHIDRDHFLMSVGGNLFFVDTKDSSAERIYHQDNNVRIMEYAAGNVAIGDYSGNITVLNTENGQVIYQQDFNTLDETNAANAADSDNTSGTASDDIQGAPAETAADTEDELDTSDAGTEDQLDDTPAVTYGINALSWNDDGSRLAIGLNYQNEALTEDNSFHQNPEQNKIEEDYFKENPPYGLVLLDPATGSLQTISTKRTDYVAFRGDAIMAEHYHYPDTLIQTYPAGLDVIRSFNAALYSAEDGACLFASDPITAEVVNSFGENVGVIDYDGEATNLYLVWFGNTGAVIDADTHKVLFLDAFLSDIIYMGTVDDYNVDFVLSNGAIQHMRISDDINLRTNRITLDLTVSDAWVKDGIYYLREDNTDNLICCANTEWDGYQKVTASDNALTAYKVSEIQYEETDKGNVRIVKFQDTEREYRRSEYCSAFEIYENLSDQATFSYCPEDKEGTINYITVSRDGTLVTIVEQTSDYATIISRYLLSDGSLVFRYVNEETEELTFGSVGTCKDRSSYLWIENSLMYEEVLYSYDLSGSEVKENQEIIGAYNMYDIIMTADDRYMVWMSKTADSDDVCIGILDRNSGETTYLPLPENMDIDFRTGFMPIKDSMVLIKADDLELQVLNAEEQSYGTPIEVESRSAIGYLAASDELLISHDRTIDLVDFESRQVLDQLELDYNPMAFVTDSRTDTFAAQIDTTYRSTNDNGWDLGSTYIIHIDQNRKMYTQFHIVPYNNDIYFNPSGNEVTLVSPKNAGYFYFDHVLSFEELVEKARSLQ